MKNCRKVRKWSRLLILAGLLTALWGSTASASPMELPESVTEAEGEAVSVFVQVTEAAKGYEKADENSRVVAELEQGRKLLMLVKVDSGWCQVMDSGRAMYVQTAYVEELAADGELAAELQGLEEQHASEAEYDIQARQKMKQGRIWGIVIAVLIAGVFIAGIVAAVRSGGEETEKEEAALEKKEKQG